VLTLLLMCLTTGAAVGTCPDGDRDAPELEPDRAACTAACNDDGFCCTNNFGGCAQLSCSAGCHIAWHSATKAACVIECRAANQAGCVYTHAASSVRFNSCVGHQDCGCPAEGAQVVLNFPGLPPPLSLP